MKIFQTSETDWFAAETEAEAVACMDETYGKEDAEEMREGFAAEELTPADLENTTFHDEDEGKMSFKEKLESMISRGVKFPTFFATTEY